MANPCSHSRTKVDTRTGERPRHVCLLCGLILNSNPKLPNPKITEPKKKDAGNSKEEKD